MYYCCRKENNLYMIHCTAHKSGEHEKGKKEIPKLLKWQCNRLLDDYLAGLVHECTPRMLLAFLLFLSWFFSSAKVSVVFLFWHFSSALWSFIHCIGPDEALLYTCTGHYQAENFRGSRMITCWCMFLFARAGICHFVFFSVIWTASRMCLLQRLAVSSFTWKVQQEVTVLLHLEVKVLYTIASKSYDYHHMFSVHNSQSEVSHMGAFPMMCLYM